MSDELTHHSTPHRIERALGARRIYGSPVDDTSEARLPASTSALRSEETAWLALLERRVVIPVKWLIWVLTLIYWFTRQNLPAGLPDNLIFGAYVTYFMANVGFTYLAWVSGIAPGQARAFSIASLGCDVVFLVFLLYADSQQPIPSFDRDFYVFFILIIMRGLVVLRSAWENLLFGVIVTLLMLMVAHFQWQSFDFLQEWEFAMRLALIWIVFSIGWFLHESLQRHQRELLTMREQLVRTENLAVLGEVSAGIAHEINNPIGIIQACADYLSDEVVGRPEMEEEIEVIRSEAKRCKHIVQDLLDYASPEQSTEISNVDLRHLCDDALKQLSREWAEAPEIERDYADKLPTVRADGRKIAQAIMNVLNNAVQNARHPVRIGLRLLEEEVAGHRNVRLDISDNGPGIPARDMAHIFKPFFSKRRGGTGLGLAIARRVARAHRGDLTCKSRPGHGTTMTFTFPAA